ncbi:alginate lyase family protein [Bordetella genomosp. 4]|uniref:alginate lyase family protein n=1 Tax=Bordetella genomosp. 4 TaxID=463044 RepID=UPI00114003AB|nr:alginate lyase family protein [Bordetella genomosp. 4]
MLKLPIYYRYCIPRQLGFKVATFWGILLLGFQAYAYDCPVPPGAVKDIDTRVVYTDKRGSIEDPKIVAANKKAREPIDKFRSNFLNIADDYYRDPSPQKLECGKSYLEKWAAGGALLGGKVSGQGELVRFWTVGMIGAGMLKLGLDGKSASPVVQAWLQSLGDEVDRYVARRKLKSNLYYWSGYSLGVIGLVLDNKSYQEKSRDVFLGAINAIQPDGTLPLELERGQRASRYHAFAAQAIFGLALLHDKNFAELKNSHFETLVNQLKDAAAGSSFFEEKTGIKQLRISVPVWLPVYEGLTTEKASAFGAHNTKCARVMSLGGDLCNLAALRLGDLGAK